jgi:hypothetical protein
MCAKETSSKIDRTYRETLHVVKFRPLANRERVWHSEHLHRTLYMLECMSGLGSRRVERIRGRRIAGRFLLLHYALHRTFFLQFAPNFFRLCKQSRPKPHRVNFADHEWNSPIGPSAWLGRGRGRMWLGLATYS